ncbi:MAG: hypothetical protein MUE69_03475 [Myxococcota bacterium]|nr:hypothetical protein [Myxococcota bacterium]
MAATVRIASTMNDATSDVDGIWGYGLALRAPRRTTISETLVASWGTP